MHQQAEGLHPGNGLIAKVHGTATRIVLMHVNISQAKLTDVNFGLTSVVVKGRGSCYSQQHEEHCEELWPMAGRCCGPPARGLAPRYTLFGGTDT